MNLPAREVDKEIKNGLRRMVEALGVDRSTLFEFSEETEEFRVSHSWAIDGLEPLPSVAASKHWPFPIRRVMGGEIWKLSAMEDLPAEATVEKEFYLGMGIKSALAIPLSVGGAIVGALAISTDRSERTWPDELVRRLRLLGEVFANALQRKRGEEALDKAFTEIDRLRKQLQMENLYLREEIKLEYEHAGIVGRSDVIKGILKQVEQVANTGSTVLIQGETGTGKELIARAIHDLSPRRERALVKVTCAALPSTLIESELFGREKGAYTGALSTQTGRFEVADGSTIFLDEVGELSLEVQAKLLRVLQEGEFERLGSSRTTRVDARVIAATNLMEIERNHMLKVLAMTGWRIRGKDGAAELLGLKPTTLHSRMKKLGIKREAYRRYFVYGTIFRLKCCFPESPTPLPSYEKSYISR